MYTNGCRWAQQRKEHAYSVIGPNTMMWLADVLRDGEACMRERAESRYKLKKKTACHTRKITFNNFQKFRLLYQYPPPASPIVCPMCSLFSRRLMEVHHHQSACAMQAGHNFHTCKYALFVARHGVSMQSMPSINL